MVIIHYLPIEHYPPVMNLMSVWDGEINCFTTKTDKYSPFQKEKLIIHRDFFIGGGRVQRILTFFNFSFQVFFKLMKLKPKEVMYYESLSALPALLYKFVSGKKVKLIVHYHEYTTKEEYQNGMFITRYLHQLEKKMYSKFFWISHTNAKRKDLFARDVELSLDKISVMPNYPMKSWVKEKNTSPKEGSIKLVFVGYSLDPKSCFIEELWNCLAIQEIETEIHAYILDKTSLPNKFLDKNGNTQLFVHQAVEYANLPEELQKHDIGLILYKGLIPNYVHNAPNKLFEYLACGLDVWYPKVMEGIDDYQSNDKPKVIAFDFNTLINESLKTYLVRQESQKIKKEFWAENVYLDFKKQVLD